MRKLTLFEKLARWKRSRDQMSAQIEAILAENAALRDRLATCQKEKAHAENQLSEVRRDKERLRTNMADQKKAVEAAQRVTDQVNQKLLEAREENERLRKSRKK